MQLSFGIRSSNCVENKEIAYCNHLQYAIF